MSRFIISLLAKQELKEINRYIARLNYNAARRLINRIKQQCKLLADFPEMGQKCDELEPDIRSFPVENYIIFYRLIDDGVQIVRVISGYRDLEVIFSQDIDG